MMRVRPSRGGGPSRVSGSLAFLAVVLALAGAADVAVAGEYQLHVNCTTPGGVNHLFVASSTDTTSYTTSEECPTAGGRDGGIHVGETLHSPRPQIAGGAHAQYTFSALSGTTITGISYRRSLGQLGDNDVIPGLRDATGALVGSEWCQYPNGDFSCSRGSESIGVAPTDIVGLNTTALAFGLVCVPQAPAISCLSSVSNEQAWFSVYSADITIRQTTTPTLGTTSGSLLDGEWQQGSRTVTLSSASDTSGIEQLGLAIDGGVAAPPSSGAAPSCDFTLRKPCVDLGASTWTLDTTTLADGQHAVAVVAQNPASISTSTGPLAFKVDNTPPGAPVALTSSAGVDWQGSNSTHLTWTLPPEGEGSPTTVAFTSVCDRNGLNCGPETPSASLTSADVAVSPTVSSSSTLRVQLEDAAGRGPSATIPFRYSAAAPPAPTAMTSSASAWQSSPRINVAWVPPARSPDEAPIVSGLVEVCDEDGSHCRAAQPVGPAGGAVDLPGEGPFQLRGRVVNAAGQSDPDQYAATPALYSSTVPTITILRHDPVAASTSRRYSIEFRVAQGGPAPLSSTRWRLCEQGGPCVASGQTTDDRLSGVVQHAGTWLVRLEAVDQAGRRSAPAESHFVFVEARRLRPGLTANARLRTGRLWIRIRGDRRVAGSVRGQFRYRFDSGRRVKAVTVHLRRGFGRAVVHVPRTVTRGLLAVRFPGSARFGPQRLLVTVRHAAPTVRNRASGPRSILAFEGAFGHALHR